MVRFIFAIEVLTSLGEQISVLSEVKTPSRDGNAEAAHSCHPKVRPLKGYDHFTIQIRQDPNNSVISSTKYMQLHFIKIYYVITLTSGEIFYVLVFTF